ncbi:MAG: CBS and ACT domain-containing protein [Desulfobacteraceae bacterium]
MFVTRSMAIKVATVDKETSLLEAQELMKQRQIRHLPVVDSTGRLVGMVTDRDIRSALPYILAKGEGDTEVRDKYAHLKVADVMTTDLLTISPNHTLQDAILLIEQKKVGAFPVVDNDKKLVGILSVRDLLRAFINVLGIGEPGTLVCVLVEEKIGQLKKIVDIVTEENISCGSVLVARYWEKNKRAVFIYLLSNNVTRVKRRLQEIGFKLLDPMDWYLDQLPDEA